MLTVFTVLLAGSVNLNAALIMLLYVLLFIAILAVVYWVLGKMGLEQQMRIIIMIVIVIVLLLILLQSGAFTLP